MTWSKYLKTRKRLTKNADVIVNRPRNAQFQVLLAKLTNDQTYISSIRTFCDSYVNQPKTPKELLLISQWGSLRHASNIA
jgi:hypothetical protein